MYGIVLSLLIEVNKLFPCSPVAMGKKLVQPKKKACPTTQRGKEHAPLLDPLVKARVPEPMEIACGRTHVSLTRGFHNPLTA